MDTILAIVSRDSAYAHVLSEYITNSRSLIYKVFTFFDLTEFEVFRKANSVSVSLVDEKLAKQLPENESEIRIILTETRKAEKNTVFMYQSFEIIAKELEFKLHRSSDNASHSQLRCITIAGVKGGSGVSTLGLCLSAAAAFEGNTLFLSLDPFLVLPKDMPVGRGDISEVIYELKVHGDDYFSHAEKYIRHGKDFDYLSGVQCFEDLNMLGRAEAKSFIAGIVKSNRYDTLIVDIGRYPVCSEVFISEAETIFLIGDEGSEKTELFLQELGRLGGEGITKKLCFAMLPLDYQLQQRELVYDEYENTQMVLFAKNLLKRRRRELQGYEGYTGYNQSIAESVEKLIVREDLPSYDGKPEEKPKRNSAGFKFSLRRLVEKGMSEGMNG